MNSDRYTKYIKYFYITACVVVFLYFLPSILRLFMPFLLALVIAAPFHKIVEFLASKLRINRGISSTVIFVLILALIGALMGFSLYYLYGQLRDFIRILPDKLGGFKESFIALYEQIQHRFPSIAAAIDHLAENSGTSLDSYTPKITNSAIDYATNFAASLPSALFFALIFLLSVFFFIKDYDTVMGFFKEAIPNRTLSIFKYLKNTAWHGFVGYLKSQMILSAVTALLVAVTFWVLDIEYAVIWALIIGIIDSLPILGSGIALVPYSLILLFQGKIIMAVVVIILQIVCFVVRQVLSPRIMSSQLGLHPIVTLISIYIGNEAMGLIGMIIFPILALLVVSIYKAYKSAGSWENIVNIQQ